MVKLIGAIYCSDIGEIIINSNIKDVEIFNVYGVYQFYFLCNKRSSAIITRHIVDAVCHN